MADPKLDYKRYPRSVSWQVATVLNPSLHYSLPACLQSKHAREKRERSDAGAPFKIVPAASWKPWQEEEGLPLPPQYVSPDALCKAMPKYMRVKSRPDQMRQAHNATTLTTTSATSDSPGNHHHLPFSPHINVAIGSPSSEYSSAKLTPGSVLDSPKQQAIVASDAAVAPPQQAIKLATSAACSSASPARSPCHPPMAALVTAAAASESTTPPASAPHQNTPQTQASSGSRSCLPHRPSASRRHSGAQSPRIRSAATSPMHSCSVAEGGESSSPGQVVDPTSLQSKLNSTIAQHPELLQRVVPQMQSAAQGSPLSPASSSVGRESYSHNHHCNDHNHHHSACNYSPPLPRTPSTSGRQHSQRRTRNSHPQEPTLKTYQKISPNTYATNTVWNDRRDQDSRDRDQTQPRRTSLIKSN